MPASPPAYRLAIFDLDGTLADSLGWFLGAINLMAGRHRFRRVEAHEVDMLRGQGARQILAHVGLPLWKLPAVTADMRRLMSRDIATIRLFPGVDDALAQLDASGMALALATSNSRANAERILGPQNSARFRHFACGSALFGKRGKYEKLLHQAGVRAAEAVSIGDEIRDAEAARACGLDFAAVAWGYTLPDALQATAPRALLHDMDELLAFLLGQKPASAGVHASAMR
ncbi:HAD hydrolase-like protein [Azoarcus indigens]|uniref:Phosphoglycolate phosphatase n=1 Tax=Azoarcus indigens TaxID=29545 RepID=A0A4R6DXK4_9RHOO|nr:HAD hydrolase-like protein [Azoarcus indigens]NMG65147.1 HAD hydrolase-like protein [Azoarcus indigens]TDN49594.1 phosphoglycolate phosphatase [Azoarcus indigens]